MGPEDTSQECATEQAPTPLRNLVGGSCTLQTVIAIKLGSLISMAIRPRHNVNHQKYGEYNCQLVIKLP